MKPVHRESAEGPHGEPAPGEEPVRRLLRRRGSPDFVIEGGLHGLLARWERAADDAARRGVDDADEYLNDADGRQILEEALAVAPPPPEREAVRARLAAADAKVKQSVPASDACLWGDAAAREKGWTPAGNWWYFRRPTGAGRGGAS